MHENNRVSVADRIAPGINRYYLKVSKNYRNLVIVLMCLFLVYLAGVMTFFGEYITYDNIKYLIRDWSAVTMPGSGDFTDIVYTADDSTGFISFRGGLALYDSDKYVYYDESGICLVEDEPGYADPAASVSDKYLLLYDIGGNGYTLYNQLTRIISRETDLAIITGDVADDGSMILVTRSRETKFTAEVYNSAFTKIMKIYKENYVLDAAISPDGKNIVICSAVASDTDFNLEVEICRTGASERTALMTYEHTMPLDVKAYDSGFVLLCDNGLYYFDYDGHITASISFDGMMLSGADIHAEGAAVVGHVNALGSENRVIVCTGDGTVLCDRRINERVSGISASLDTSEALAYIISGNSLLTVFPDERIGQHEPESGEILALIPRKRGVLVCRESGAYAWSAE